MLKQKECVAPVGSQFFGLLWISSDFLITYVRIVSMRKIITTTMITLDGVMQAPGASKEDTAEGFKYGGWMVGWDEEADKITDKIQAAPFDMLFGRRTYNIFAASVNDSASFPPSASLILSSAFLLKSANDLLPIPKIIFLTTSSSSNDIVRSSSFMF